MAYKLIVAESSPSVQKAVDMAFSEDDFEIFPFEDGLEVMKSISQISPDAILLGLSLPSKDGYEVGFHLKRQEEFSHVSIILLKGTFEPLDREKIARLDCDEIIQKPFDSERLARIVRDIIERKRNPRTLPEEPLLDESTGTESNPDSQKVNSHMRIFSQDGTLSQEEFLSSFFAGWKAETGKEIRNIIRKEILSASQEMEKRIRTQLLKEFKDWIKEGMGGEKTLKE